jgi:hypothetical protein
MPKPKDDRPSDDVLLPTIGHVSVPLQERKKVRGYSTMMMAIAHGSGETDDGEPIEIRGGLCCTIEVKYRDRVFFLTPIKFAEAVVDFVKGGG